MLKHIQYSTNPPKKWTNRRYQRYPEFCCLLRHTARNNGADSTGHGEMCPQLIQIAGHGGERGTVSRTANKKLTKLYWPSRKRSSKRLIVLVQLNSGGAWQKKCLALCAWCVPTVPPTFKFVLAALVTKWCWLKSTKIHKYCRITLASDSV